MKYYLKNQEEVIMNFFKATKIIVAIAVSAVIFTGCTGGESGSSQGGTEVLEGTLTSSGVYFAPLAPDASETPIANETVTISTADETVGVTTDQAGKFKMQLRKRDGSCSVSGGGQKKRYGGSGNHGAGQKINWNFVDNDGDGVCDNTIEVILK